MAPVLHLETGSKPSANGPAGQQAEPRIGKIARLLLKDNQAGESFMPDIRSSTGNNS